MDIDDLVMAMCHLEDRIRLSSEVPAELKELSSAARTLAEEVSFISQKRDITATRKIESLGYDGDVNNFLELGWVLIKSGRDGGHFVVAWMSDSEPSYPTTYNGKYHSDNVQERATW